MMMIKLVVNCDRMWYSATTVIFVTVLGRFDGFVVIQIASNFQGYSIFCTLVGIVFRQQHHLLFSYEVMIGDICNFIGCTIFEP